MSISKRGIFGCSNLGRSRERPFFCSAIHYGMLFHSRFAHARAGRAFLYQIQDRPRAMLAETIGLAAAVCTTVAYFPQLKKSWQTRRTDDLSLAMLLVLSSGVALWVVYGVVKADWVIIAATRPTG